MSYSPFATWTGPLDVPAFAMDVVQQAATAAARFSRARGLDLLVDTTPSLVAGSFAAIDQLRVEGSPVEAWGELSGYFEATDGWVRLHGNYPHHTAAIRRALGVEGRADVAEVIGRMPADVAVQRILDRGGIAAAVRTTHEWEAHPQSRAMRDVPWCQVEPGAERPDPPVDRPPERGSTTHRRMSDLAPGDHSPAPLPLDGVRVLDLTRVVAGPMCTQLLACLGADVLRIDPPHRPEMLEAYLASGMGKRSAVMDLASGEITQLLAGADVVVLGYRPGALTRFGLDPETLRERFPQLVIGTLSAWGEVGPWGERAGFDSIVQAATGIAHVSGTTSADGSWRPGALPVQALDHSTGLLLAAGILDLLAERRGGVVQTHLLGAARTLLNWSGTAVGGRATCGDRGEADGRHGPTAPHVSDTSGRSDIPAGTSHADVDMAEPESGPPSAVELDSPHGRIRTAPVPIRLGGVALAAPISGYGAAAPRW